jgi:hypothetical protein
LKQGEVPGLVCHLVDQRAHEPFLEPEPRLEGGPLDRRPKLDWRHREHQLLGRLNRLGQGTRVVEGTAQEIRAEREHHRASPAGDRCGMQQVVDIRPLVGVFRLGEDLLELIDDEQQP